MPVIPGNLSFARNDTISCLLCKGFIGFNEKETSRYEEHLALEHRVVYHIPWIINKTVKEFWKKIPVQVETEQSVFDKYREELENSENRSFSIRNVTANDLPTQNVENRSVSIRGSIKNVVSNQFPVEKLVSVKREKIGKRDEELLLDEAMELTSQNDSLQEGFMKFEDGKLLVANNDDDNADDNMIEESDGKYQCEACPDVFLNRKSHERHIRSKHTVDKMYPCNVCGKSFKTRSYVTIHEKIHTKETAKPIKKREKPLQCTLCLKYFKTEQFLKNHLENHS